MTYFVEIETCRYLEHCGPNDDASLGYRDIKELKKWKKKDPLIFSRNYLIKKKFFSKKNMNFLDNKIINNVDKDYFYLTGLKKPKFKNIKDAEIITNVKSNVEIILDGTRRAFIFGESDDNIIDAAQANGIDVPFSCKGGMCCTCRCKITKGDVTMNANYSLEDWEMEAGFVLACQAVPQTKDIILDFDAS